jgi:hypothetical protein
MKSIEVIIHQDGTATVEGKGFSGPECEKATKEIEAALGLTSQKKKKPEFFCATSTTAKQRT